MANPPWDDDTKTGAYGVGSHATAEVEEKVDHVQQIHEQHKRREERRDQGYGEWGLFKKK